MSTTTAEPTAQVEQFTCTECGRSFTRKQGLGRHMSETHGAATTRSSRAKAETAKSEPVSALTQAERELNEMLKPLHARLSKIDKEIAKHTQSIKELREARAVYANAIRKIDPAKTAETARRSESVRASASLAATRNAVKARKLDALRLYLDKHADELRGGFTANQLAAQTKAAQIDPPMGHTTVAELIEQLRSEGVVRADKLVRGGGMQFMLVSSNGDGGHDAEA